MLIELYIFFIDGIGGEKVESGQAGPSEQEVIEHARTYPGDAATGVPAGAIPEIWAKKYWSWRTAKEDWPKGWRWEMFHRFQGEWLAGGVEARGRLSSKPGQSKLAGNRDGEPPLAVKSCRVTLDELLKLVA